MDDMQFKKYSVQTLLKELFRRETVESFLFNNCKQILDIDSPHKSLNDKIINAFVSTKWILIPDPIREEIAARTLFELDEMMSFEASDIHSIFYEDDNFKIANIMIRFGKIKERGQF